MDSRFLSLIPRGLKDERGIALVTAFLLSLLFLGLIASLYWVIVQRSVLTRSRSEQSRSLYLVEAGMNDAIARIRLGGVPAGINRATGRTYCLDVETATITRDILAECTTACTDPGEDVRVCVSLPDVTTGRNEIRVTAF